jgi:phosphoglycerol transferase MdoB-like AlkP superfamily enzyme
VNLGILYYSGLYFSPIALEHLAGSGEVINNQLTYLLVGGTFVIIIFFILLVKKNLRVHGAYGLRYSSFYNYSLGLVAFAAILAISSFKNTPEQSIVQSFYKYYFGKDVERTLDLQLQKKLAKFGLIYETNQFYVNSRNEVFTPTTTKLLSDKFKSKKPNILIIELESFSGRLTGPYGTKFSGLTPGLDEFAADKNTTVFKKYYNASTPTITGILSQFCSFLPPTGHNEIQNERKLQSHRLLCLPEVLKKHGDYKYAGYVTAVDKSFANKNGIFLSMGMDKVFGTDELANYIEGRPLSWGYSDHQMFPAVLNFMESAPEPFMYVLSTVDTHPPFDLAKDALNFGDGSKPVLNSFHTTDDAFKKFWQEFKKSKLYDDTIVVAVADHAIFPGALTTDLFKEDAQSLTYYDENFFAIYVPESVLPKNVSVYSSGIDLTPTLLQILDINVPNSFEGHSIFDSRPLYPNLLGMHELGLYINQQDKKGVRHVDYDVPSEIECNGDEGNMTDKLTLCEYLRFYEWKRQMFEEGRFWKH